ncbi:PREDICTED: taste receptor type 2 member 19-like [Condylura cristata]|uniref:taste receptor type 2 member 19-like n=1 Tax=Condylura cristata TaxID=143302 RepID=UPI0003345C8A|nr:PREDICTED: taste receptor type 2 member 19-like [Condylura cristata]
MTFLLNIHFILIMIVFIAGNLANGFIALVNCIDWVKRQRFSSADGILTGLAVSRIGLIWITLINRYATVFVSASYTLEVNVIVNLAWITCNHLSTWLATCLNIFYLFKIANFSNLLFFYLKRRIKRVVLAILLGSSVFWIMHVAVTSVEEDVWTSEYEGNTTGMSTGKEMIRFSHMTVVTVVNFIPFLMSLASFLLLIFSLWKHLKKMQLRGKGSPDPSTKVHIRAMQTMVSFLLLFTIFVLALIISLWSSNKLQNKLSLVFCESLLVLYPSSHSCILIWGNQKLKQVCMSLLRQLNCWLEERKQVGAPESLCRKQTGV